MQFTFNAVELYVVTVNEKPWTCAMEVCSVLEYNKKITDIVKVFCSKEKCAQKYQMSSVTAAGKPVDCPKESQKYDIYINEEGIYGLLFSSHQPQAKDFRRHCCNVLYPHVQQRLSDKSHAMEIEDLKSCVQGLEFTNEAHQQEILRLSEEHKQVNEEKDATIALLNDEYEYENLAALQAQKNV